jgi:uncharacterized protein (UPF0335 family)
MTDATDAYNVTADELRQFIERAEQLEAEKKDIGEQEKELFAEAKGRGYDTKIMRRVIALRKRKPLVASKTNTPVFTVGGTSLVMRQFAMNLGNQIETRFLINSESVMLVDHAETIDMTVEAEPLTTINPFQLAVNQTQTPVIVQHGVTAGSRITINAPLAQVQRPTGVEENQGIAEWPLKLIPQQNAGNDQWTLAIT